MSTILAGLVVLDEPPVTAVTATVIFSLIDTSFADALTTPIYRVSLSQKLDTDTVQFPFQIRLPANVRLSRDVELQVVIDNDGDNIPSRGDYVSTQSNAVLQQIHALQIRVQRI